MSSLKWYRQLSHTPAGNNSPALAYFTPKKRVNLASNGQLKKPDVSCGRLSAEYFRKREDIKKRYYFYQRSPSTPLYKRCQLIKKKLVFSEDDIEDDTEAKTDQKIDKNIQNNPFIPTIQLTSPGSNFYCPHKSKTYKKTPYRNHLKIREQILKSGEEYLSSDCKMATPNTVFILQNLSPLSKQKVLGRGRFGCVIESYYKNIKVAIKVIDMSKSKLKASILGEQNAIGLMHPNVVRTNSIIWPKDMTNGRYCIVMMEWCSKADNLERVLDNDDGMFITPKRIVRYSLDICGALNFLHSKGILHLDVKPKNILICPSDICKLCDFGSSLKYRYCSNRKVNFGVFRGTAQYCSPEILQGLSPTPSSDVYSFGITMWQLLHRTTPYGNQTPEESLIYRVVKDGLRPHTELRFSNNFVNYYHNIYSACWMENPKERLSISLILKNLNDLQFFLANRNYK